ncbi:MAG: TssN family type VI secretion system protein [Bacteroidota bacterium]
MIKQVQPTFSFNDFVRLLFQNRRRAGVYGLTLIIISFNLCLFLPANMHTPSAERLVNVVQLCCFGIMGIVNVWFFYKRNFLAELFFSEAKLAFILLLFILIGLVLFIYYYVTGNNGLMMAFASSSAFLLPFIIYQGWMEYVAIPAKKMNAWHLPVVEAGNNNAPLSTASTMQIQLKISRKENDTVCNIFPVTTSGKVKLGKVFERFIIEQNNQGVKSEIEIKNKKQAAFGWQFQEEKWYGLYSRSLNPLRSLLENNVKPNAKIIVTRV